jgi:hypothetical protein
MYCWCVYEQLNRKSLSFVYTFVQGPATSLAYEPAEASVMSRPPRDISVERLVSVPLLAYAYIIVGVAESLCCFGAYLWTFRDAGVPIRDIFLIRNPEKGAWSSQQARIKDDFHASNGNVFEPWEQELIVRQVSSCV